MIKEEDRLPEEKKDNNLSKNTLQRRTLLKALVGIPVLGAFAYEVVKKATFDKQKRERLIRELGLEGIEEQENENHKISSKGDLIRVGIIGFGSRAVAHAKGLGYLHPDQAEGVLDDWLQQEDLNVAITGICDVFDLHAEKGIEIARDGIRVSGTRQELPVKRYMRYQDMLDDENIDAVMIATPDHHHAEITIAAAKAGKHVYCEKSMALTEEEVFGVYNAVKDSNIVYQLGHQISQSSVFQQAKEIVKKGLLGKITLVETTTNRNSANGAWIRHLDSNGKLKPGDEKTIDWEQWLGPAPKVPFSVDRYYNWTKWFAYDIGLIGQLFTHEYDAVNQLLRIGIPKSAIASGGIYYWKDNREIPDTMHAVFEYPDNDLTLIYSASLANSKWRGRMFMGSDATMELGSTIQITADSGSKRYKKQIEEGLINTNEPMVTFNSSAGKVDAVTSATAKYYASRGLTTTTVNGRKIDITYLHIKEWIDCIRNGKTPTANIERAFEEGITCVMAIRSYFENRKVEWDPVKRKIV